MVDREAYDRGVVNRGARQSLRDRVEEEGRLPSEPGGRYDEWYGRDYGGWYGRGTGRADLGREEGGFRGRGPKGYRRSDERIREDVSDRLADAADVDASDIEVAVQDGEVTLSGTVDGRHARRRAEDLAESVSGVRYVQNNLRARRQDRGGPPVYEGATSASAMGGLDAGMGSAGETALSGSAAGASTLGTTGGRSGAAPGVTGNTGMGYSRFSGTDRSGGGEPDQGRHG
jgi:hypothetical protein